MPPPPHYPDDTNDCRSSLILPREEEGKEDLPAYHCSVYKMATMEIKMERGPGRRSWRQVYLELWGTVLRIYPFTWFWSSVAKEPTYILSLAGAEAARALDYRKRPFVFRLTSGNGIKLLIQSANLEEMVSWIEHLQSGINISLDLEERPMPKFLTMPPRRGPPDTGILGQRMIEVERRREQRRLNQQEILA
ncbi:hypothetical protein BC941DRAFT_419523 [Chlamydoabsidia padenii]|nr:hypothetical protein BC941DRAFT_419523 [Chlamydoabsidia padenii]